MIRFVDSMNRDNDVVVTGIGMVTPLGGSTSDTWQRLIAGDTAGRPLQHHEIDAFEALTVLLGHPPGGAPATQRLSDAWSGSIARPSPLPAQLLQAWRSEPYVSLLLDALFEAARDAKLELPVASPLRTGCVIGASKGGLRTLEKLAAPHSSSGKSLLETSSHENPFLWDNAAHPDAALRAATVTTGAEAFQTCPVAACATGLISILQAACRIVAGECDICFAGSSDAALRATVVSAYHRLRVTSRSAHPATACRPFDRSRDGFIIGEGAAVVVLESRRHAHSRGVSPIARLTAGGWLNDTSGMAQIDTAGTCVTELIHRVMAALPDEGRVDWINLHGTATEANDLAESAAVAAAFGAAPPLCTGWKGAFGHLLGAAGSVETALTFKALQEQLVPGTTNLQTPDPLCPIQPVTRNVALPGMHRAMKLSLGFGGHISCAVFDSE